MSEERKSANFEAKKLVVEEITAKIKEAKSVVLVDYNKLTVAEFPNSETNADRQTASTRFTKTLS